MEFTNNEKLYKVEVCFFYGTETVLHHVSHSKTGVLSYMHQNVDTQKTIKMYYVR